MRQEEPILKQKSHIQWLKLGHNNSAYLHKMIKDKQMRNSICALLSLEGTRTTNISLSRLSLFDYFQSLLGAPSHGLAAISTLKRHLWKMLFVTEHSTPVAPITDDEIKRSIFFLARNKAPRLDSYTSTSKDVQAYVKSFFRSWYLPPQVNANHHFAPKKKICNTMNDFSLIFIL